MVLPGPSALKDKDDQLSKHEPKSSNGRRLGGVRPWRVAGVVAALAVTALLAACGSASYSSGSGPSTQHQKIAAFTQCMRGRGQSNFYVTQQSASNSSRGLQSLDFTGGKPGSPQYKSAMAACTHLLAGNPPPAATKQQIDSAVKSAQCMHAHGFPSYPEPVVQNGQILMVPLPSSIDASSPQFLAAAATCGEPHQR
jgi:hypothetical protein